MLHNNIYYEYDKVLNKDFIVDSKVFEKFSKGKISADTKKNFTFDYLLVDTYKKGAEAWEFFNVENGLHYPRTLFRYLDNVNLFKCNRYNEFILTFQKDSLELERYLEIENHFNDNFQIAMNFTKTWFTPGKTPLMVVTKKDKYFYFFKHFDPNLKLRGKLKRDAIFYISDIKT